MTKFDELYKSLDEEIMNLKSRYIMGHIPAKPESGPDVFSYDVKAFCLMSHASFEEFVEAVSETVMSEIESDFLNKKIKLSTACFILNYGRGSHVQANEREEQVRCFDAIRDTITYGKKTHSDKLESNHGFSIKYLRSVLAPIGINVPVEDKMLSVKKLADARGTFAHTMAKTAMYGDYKKANKVMTPEEAKEIVEDCLSMCSEIRERAKNIW